MSLNTEIEDHTEILSIKSLDKLKGFTDGYELLFVDEAQRIPDIGLTLKLIHTYDKATLNTLNPENYADFLK